MTQMTDSVANQIRQNTISQTTKRKFC